VETGTPKSKSTRVKRENWIDAFLKLTALFVHLPLSRRADRLPGCNSGLMTGIKYVILFQERVDRGRKPGAFGETIKEKATSCYS
jgi:hypothetical protein